MNENEYIKRIIEDYILSCDQEVMWTKWNGKDWSGPIRACVLCSDTFYFASADAETIEPEDIDELISFSKEGDKNGSYMGDIIWCCKKRNKRVLKAYWNGTTSRPRHNTTFKNWMDKVVPLTEETKGIGE